MRDSEETNRQHPSARILEVGSGPGVFPFFFVGWGNFTAEVQKEEELHFTPRFEVVGQKRQGWFWDIRLCPASSCGEEFWSFEDKAEANFPGALRDGGLGTH